MTLDYTQYTLFVKKTVKANLVTFIDCFNFSVNQEICEGTEAGAGGYQ